MPNSAQVVWRKTERSQQLLNHLNLNYAINNVNVSMFFNVERKLNEIERERMALN